MKLALGAKPPRPGAVKLAFRDYINTSVLATPPASFGHDRLVGPNWGALANAQTPDCPNPVGDCAIADALHQHLLWNTETGVDIPLSDECALENYAAVTGYTPMDTSGNPWPPGENPTDQGTDVPELLKHRLTKGLVDAAGNIHKIGAAVALEPGDWEALIYAMYYFDGVTLGIAMSEDWMAAFSAHDYVWDAVPYPNIAGGHAITGVAFHDQLARIITWGTDEVGVTENGYRQASNQTFAVFSEERLKNGIDINGIDEEKLVADLPLLQDITTRLGDHDEPYPYPNPFHEG
jgi:hypothetical protein